jgi:hypothetical protein
MPPKKKEQVKAGSKVVVDKTFGLKNVTRLKFAWCGSLIAEKQIQKSTAVCAAGSTTTGRHRHQCKGKGNFLRLCMPLTIVERCRRPEESTGREEKSGGGSQE